MPLLFQIEACHSATNLKGSKANGAESGEIILAFSWFSREGIMYQRRFFDVFPCSLAACPFERPHTRLQGHTIRKTKAQETHERQPVVNLLGAFVRQRVDWLDHKHLEHQNRIDWRSTTLAAIRVGQRLLQIGPELLEIHRPRKRLQLIAKAAQPRKPLIHAEKSRLIHDAFPKQITRSSELHLPHQIQRFFEPSNL